MRGMIRKSMFQKPLFRDLGVCIDLETMGVSADAVVLSIAAVAFDTKKISSELELRSHSFVVNCTEASNFALQRTFDQSTVDWWASQSNEAKMALQEPEPIHVVQAVKAFDTWVRSLPQRVCSVWANSPSFDHVILQHLYKQAGLRWPFSYHIERDCRTLKNICGAGLEFFTFQPKHSALSDVLSEVAMIQLLLQNLREHQIAC